MLLNKFSMTRIISVNLLMDSQLKRLSNRKKPFPLNDSCDPRPRFLASVTSLVTEASGRSALRHLYQSRSAGISGTHEVGQLSWLWRQTPHTQGDGNKPPTRALSSPSYYLFSAPVWCGFLFSTYCTVVTCWPLFDFCMKKKLCYRNQHTIFLNLERRYYGDWKYGQVSNINV